jgi:ADP-ribosyl-[dinitrogen reductase] hydrolase
MHYERVTDGFFGLCVGEALGLPVDCRSRNYLRQNPVLEMEGFGTYNQPPGTWSDAGSLTFCAADALTSGFNRETLAENFILWHDTGYWTPNGEIVGRWNPTVDIIERFRSRQTNPGGNKKQESAANFSLLWMIPYAYLTFGLSEQKRAQIVQEVVEFVYPDKIGSLGAVIYVEIANRLLQGVPIRESVIGAQEFIAEYFKGDDRLDHFSMALGGRIISLTEDDVRASNQLTECLTAVIWTILQNNGYRETLLRAVNLGEDTDAIGAAVGGLAGIAYGLKDIPAEWIAQIAKKEEIQELCMRFSAKMKSWEARRLHKSEKQKNNTMQTDL